MIYISEKSVFYVNQVYGQSRVRASYIFDFFLSVSANVGTEHGKRNAFFRRVHLDDGNIHHVAHADNVRGFSHKVVRKARNMHKAVLMHADIDERAEIDYVADGAGQLHAGGEIVHAQHVAAQKDGREIVARVAPGLVELGDDIGERGQAEAELFGKALCAEYFPSAAKSSGAPPRMSESS